MGGPEDGALVPGRGVILLAVGILTLTACGGADGGPAESPLATATWARGEARLATARLPSAEVGATGEAEAPSPSLPPAAEGNATTGAPAPAGDDRSGPPGQNENVTEAMADLAERLGSAPGEIEFVERTLEESTTVPARCAAAPPVAHDGSTEPPGDFFSEVIRLRWQGRLYEYRAYRGAVTFCGEISLPR